MEGERKERELRSVELKGLYVEPSIAEVGDPVAILTDDGVAKGAVTEVSRVELGHGWVEDELTVEFCPDSS
ncbi:MAG TPA: hypothetical protein VJ653_07320 [Acidimicrobiales bacterium]|nr:hypothetical protein [Acidimicrobiales bacterium]